MKTRSTLPSLLQRGVAGATCWMLLAVVGCVDDGPPSPARNNEANGAGTAGAGGLFGGTPSDLNPQGGDDGSGPGAGDASSGAGRCGGVPTSAEPRIDNFEDGDTYPIAETGRLGAWHIPPLSGDQVLTFEIEPHGADGTDFAARVTVAGFDSRASLGASLRFDREGVSCPYNVSDYGALGFYARGSGTLDLLLDTTDTWSTEFGGACRDDIEQCWDVHHKLIPLTSDWKYHEVRWDAFSQAGWGMLVAFNPEHLLGVEFAVSPDALPAEFWLDEIRFVTP